MTTFRLTALSTFAALSVFAGCSSQPKATAERAGSEAAAATPALATGHAPVQSPAAIDPPATPAAVIGPPKNGTTVAAVWTTRAALAGTRVTLRGKVVKYNGGILGVNWIHIQDGSGNAADGSNDITITSEMDTKVGDTITVTGIVAVNKDLGSGYQYPVIVEHASIAQK